jgi:hypothetical protein
LVREFDSARLDPIEALRDEQPRSIASRLDKQSPESDREPSRSGNKAFSRIESVTESS